MTSGRTAWISRLAWSHGDRLALEAMWHDWRFEASEARGPVAAAIVSCRWAWAVTLTLLRVMCRDAVRPATLAPLGVGLLLAAIAAVAQYVILWRPDRYVPSAIVWMLPASLTVFIAPALAVACSWMRRPAFFGAAALTALTMLAMVGWVVPESNQQFRVRTYLALSEQADPPPLARGTPELTIGPLVASAADSERGGRARAQLLNHAAKIVWAVTGIGLGCAIARYRRDDRARWKYVAVSVATLLLIWVGSVSLLMLSWRLLGPTRGGTAIWIVVAGFTVAALAVVRVAEGRRVTH